MSCMFNRYHQFISSLQSSLTSYESKFLEGTGKDLSFLSECYIKLQTINKEDMPEFEENLQAMHSNSKTSDICKDLADGYKNLANTTEMPKDFIKAAFWFKMLYLIDANDSYLNDYKNMLIKGKKND